MVFDIKTILQNYRKRQFHGHFPIIPLQNSMVKKIGSHCMTLLCPNLCYRDVL